MQLLRYFMTAALFALPMTPALAEAPFADSICPEAAQYVTAAGRLRSDDPPQRVYDAAVAAVNAYERCSTDKLSNGFREPQHYADTRAAAFAVLASRALVRLDRLEEAQRLLQHWRPLAVQVVEWQSELETPHDARRPGDTSPMGTTPKGADANGSRGSDHRGSLYRPSAKDVVAAIDGELTTIAERSRNVVRPQAKPSPGP